MASSRVSLSLRCVHGAGNGPNINKTLNSIRSRIKRGIWIGCCPPNASRRPSYGHGYCWCRLQESNPRPTDYKSHGHHFHNLLLHLRPFICT